MVLMMGESDRLGGLAFREILRPRMGKGELNGGEGGGARVTQLSLLNHQEPHPTAILQSEPAKLHQNFTRVRDLRLDIHFAPSRHNVLAGLSGAFAGRGAACTGPPGGPPNRSSGGALDPDHPLR